LRDRFYYHVDYASFYVSKNYLGDFGGIAYVIREVVGTYPTGWHT